MNHSHLSMDERRPDESASEPHAPGGRTPSEGPVQSGVARLDQVRVTYPLADGGEKHALRGVSIAVAEGEFVALVGRSGCGKTTILNTLAGLVEPTTGSISVLGTSPRKARDRLGYMLARDALLPWRTAVRNVELGLEIQGVDKPRRRRLAEEALAGVGLSAVSRYYPWQLSHGMRQRVALARTWVTQPRLLLMDEPFAALDAQTRDSVRAQFIDVWERDRKSVVFVTHDISEALLLADRVLVIADGVVKRDVAVPFERPRKPYTLRLESAFIHLERELWELIE